MFPPTSRDSNQRYHYQIFDKELYESFDHTHARARLAPQISPGGWDLARSRVFSQMNHKNDLLVEEIDSNVKSRCHFIAKHR